MKNSADRFAHVREELGMSQIEIAKAAGVNRDTWRRYENGDLPTGATLQALRRLGFSIDWLLTGEGPIHVAPENPAALREEGAPYHHLDAELMGRVVDAIVKLYKEENARLSPVDQGRMAAEIYDEVMLVPNAADRVGVLSYLIEARRRSLRRAADDPAHSKRQA